MRVAVVVLALGLACRVVGQVPDAWESSGAIFDLSELKTAQFAGSVSSVGGSSLKLKLAGGLPCRQAQRALSKTRQPPGSDVDTSACMVVPGVPPNVAATVHDPSLQLLDRDNPGHGFSITMAGGDHCDVVKRGRIVEARFICDPTGHHQSVKAWEGTGTKVCHYVMEIVTAFACPTGAAASSDPSSPSPPPPILAGVSGCADSTSPPSTTTGCKAGETLYVHGTGLANADSVKIYVGKVECLHPRIINNWQLSCILPDIDSLHADVEVHLHGVPGSHAPTADDKEGAANEENNKEDTADTRLHLEAAVVYVPSLKRLHHQFQSFEDLGVGGLNKEISAIYRRVFQSRALPDAVVSALGIKHIKGILLYGPPGSGKTLAARTIAKLFGSDKVHLINTPDIMQKYLGESEKQLRQYFEAARTSDSSQSPSDVHFIIFDEIDAIFRERGRGDGSAASMAYDSVVNALLTQMDGLEEMNNVIVFGMTNRRELIDPALLRPGRFEVQVEIGLPDLEGRRSILNIHTQEMRDNGLLHSDVDLDVIARRTTRYSGAELAGIVRNAASLAVSRVMADPDAATHMTEQDISSMKIRMEDFTTALQELNPAYTDHRDNTEAFYFPHGFLPLSVQHEAAHEVCASAIAQSGKVAGTARRILLFGGAGTGKTSVAVHAALASSPPFLKILRASDLVDVSESQRAARIAAAFRDAQRTKHAVLVLDDIERVAEVVPTTDLQGSYSHSIVHTLLTCLTSIPPASSLVVLATTRHDPRETSFVTNVLQTSHIFDTAIRIPALAPSDVRSTAQILDCDLRGVTFSPRLRIPIRSLLQVVTGLRGTTANATVVPDQVSFDSFLMEVGVEVPDTHTPHAATD